MSFTYSSVVPLIGGIVLGQEKAFESRPEYLLSYSPFSNNDKHIVNHYDNEVPYILLDQGGVAPKQVDVVSACCPCAGLSMLSHGFGDHNENNKWMIETAKYVLGEMKPEVFYGENAPGFAGKIGKTVREQLRQIGKENGYAMTVYRTKSLLHGIPQIRERSFYFFWKGDRVPVLDYYERPYPSIEDVITGVRGNFQMETISKKTPSKDDLYYKFVLDELHGGMSHRDFVKTLTADSVRNIDVLAYLESKTDYLHVADWMGKNGYEKEVDKCKARYEKLKAGGNIMRRNTVLPRGHIGAFVGHYPVMLAHPVEDRYITYREAMSIMGMPENFELVGASPKNANHICQNVPVGTATDMATEVVEYLRGNRETVGSDYSMQWNHTRAAHYETDHNLEKFFA